MSSKNTQPARGMRDFLPADIRKRNYVINIIKEVYEKYGFEPLETPSVENLETLAGKYGEEGSQLMFKILKRGEKLQEELAEGKIKSENELSDLALRYDLTVPLARVVANYKNELPKFFKRYQIQPVWRADRPAKGRYREFYQCDVDAIGSSSMIVEAELCAAVSEILERLGFEDFVIKINDRRILTAMLDGLIPRDQQSNVLTILDKLDKIGIENFKSELKNQDINEDAIIVILGYLQNYNDLDALEKSLPDNSGVKSIRNINNFLKQITNNTQIKFDISLARGLSYYTGAIFEVVLTKGDFSGSIAGGGRYDGLIGMFGKEQIPAVGFSIGLERIIYVMEERGMFPEDLTTNSADVMITVWNEETAGESLKLASELREKELRVLVYPEADKLGKQFKYADSLGIQFVCVLGDAELAEGKVSVKNLKSGEQKTVDRNRASEEIKQLKN